MGISSQDVARAAASKKRSKRSGDGIYKDRGQEYSGTGQDRWRMSPEISEAEKQRLYNDYRNRVLSNNNAGRGSGLVGGGQEVPMEYGDPRLQSRGVYPQRGATYDPFRFDRDSGGARSGRGTAPGAFGKVVDKAAGKSTWRGAR